MSDQEMNEADDVNEDSPTQAEQEPKRTRKKSSNNRGNDASQLNAAREVLAAINGADATAEIAEDDGDDDDDQVEVIKTPSQIAGRKKTTKKSSGPRAVSVPAKVKKLMGDGERYRFYKVDKLGKAALVGDYTSADLANADNDIELFIQAYLLPTYGDGEYSVRAFSDKGVELRQGSYSVLSPKDNRPSVLASGGAGLFEQSLVTNQTAKLNALQEQIRQSEMEERQALKVANEKQAQMIASMQGDGGSTMMQMMMMMQQNSDAAQRRSEAAQRRSELQMEKLRIETQSSAAALPLPPPPPPPPQDPLSTILPLLGLLKELMPKQPEQSAETLYLRDRIRDLESRGEGPRTITDVFKDANQMDEMFRSRYGDAPSSSAADMVKGFMDNFAENMHALKEVVTAGQAPSSAKQLQSASYAPPPEDPDALPDGFIELVLELDSADDEDHPDLARINVVLKVLQLFANCGTKKYELIANQVITQISTNKRKPVLYVLKQILAECTNRDMIQESSSIATYKAFERHFDQVYETVTGETLEKEEPEIAKAEPAMSEEDEARIAMAASDKHETPPVVSDEMEPSGSSLS